MLSQASIDILRADETKLDASFPEHQFQISGYQFPPIRRDCDSKGGGKIVLARKRFYFKTNEKL